MALENDMPSEHSGESASVDGSVDWRTRAWTHLVKGVPAAYPGGPSHRAGSRVMQATVTKDAKGRNVGFTTPSAVALSLSIALKAADYGRTLHKQIEHSEGVSPFGPGTSVTEESIAALFDYFEQCMTILAFSFQAIEAYCNETISAKATGMYELRRKNGVLKLTADDLERKVSTDEKLGTILPRLLGVPTPKNSPIWSDFLELKRARDATIHIKSHDSNPRVRQPSDLDDATLFDQFLGANVFTWVRTAVSMIDYFASRNDSPQWLESAKKMLGVRTKSQTTNQMKKNRKPRSERKER